MGMTEAMATFVAAKCKTGDCEHCHHARCTHECHDLVDAAVVTAPRCPHVLQGGRQCALVEGHADGHADEAEAAAMEPIEISGGGASEVRPPLAGPSEAPAGEFALLPTERIVPAANNVRRNLGELDELATSIQAVGIVEPLIVERCADDDPEHDFHLVAGERRWTAAGMLGMELVPCVVRDSIVDDDQRVELMLIENLQRKDLDPLEEADGYRRLTDLGLSQRRIAERVGCTQAHVSHRISLLKLAPKVRQAIEAGKVTVTDALAFTKLEDHKRQEAALKAAAKPYGGDGLDVEWAVEQELRAAKDADKKAAIEAEAKKKGWPVVERDPRDYREKGYKRLVKESWENGLHVKAAAHRKEPCHALLIDSGYDGPRKVEICTAPSRHAAKGESQLKEPAPEKRPMDESEKREREEAKAKKATGARRVEFLTGRLTKKVAQGTALPVIAETLLDRCEYEAKKRAAEILGLGTGTNVAVREELAKLAAKSSDDLVRVALACALATGDVNARATWVGWENSSVQRLYGFLDREGYELDEFEQGQMERQERERAEATTAREAFLEKCVRPADLPDVVKASIEELVAHEDPIELEYVEEQLGKRTLTAVFEVCRVCGCTEDHACEGGCSWVEDDLCSTCAPSSEGDNTVIDEPDEDWGDHVFTAGDDGLCIVCHKAAADCTGLDRELEPAEA